jgi:GNAT superfamily N-acetyltransferase
MLSFRLMKPRDEDFWMTLTNSVGWGMTSKDFERILRFSPKGCFIARLDETDVGCVATTHYGKVAWIGNLVVMKEYRGKGYGEALMTKAMNHLRGEGVQTIRLDSVPKAIPLYKRLGFKEEYRSLRFTGKSSKHEVKHTRRMIIEDMDDVSKLDERYFKVKRRNLLEYALLNSPELCFTAWKGEKLEGYIMSRTSFNTIKVGPWIVNTGESELAEELLHSVMNERPGEKMWVGCPEDNHTSVSILNRNRFESLPSSLRMCYGKPILRETAEGVYGLGGPDKG